ncbi:MAG TPA: pyridoxamine 5'-phosphate oxidase family protein [Streptosporangiales bacterium]
MNEQEIADVMSRPASQRLLASNIPARFAYVGLDDAPRVVPVGYFWDGERIIVHTVPKAAKVNALRRRPKVAVTIDTEGFPPHVLLVRGEATVGIVDGVPREYVEAGRRIVPADRFEGWEAGVRALYAQMARIVVEPTWAKLLDFETTVPKAVEDLVREHRQAHGGQ